MVLPKETAMTKTKTEPSEQLQRDAEQAQLDVNKSQQKAEEQEVVGRQQNDGLKPHQGTGAPRGQ
jgi:hypothetical protein